MKKEFKIVIAGGGSTYTPGIVHNLLEAKDLGIRELWLYDIDEERQNKVASIIREVIRSEREVPLHVSCDPKVALKDADFIMAQMRVGGLKMRAAGEQLCNRHGVLGQETVGGEGIAYGMRTIKPMLELIDYCEEYAAKDYWIVNYSNPAAIVAIATTKFRPHARILNICDMPVEIEARMAEILHCDLADLEADYFGLNHFGWFTKVRCKGEDVTERLKEHVGKYGYLDPEKENSGLLKDPDWVHTFNNSKKIVSMFKDYLPNTYYQYYLMPDDIVSYQDINNPRGLQCINGREKRVFAAADALARGEQIDLQQFYTGVHGQFIVNVVRSLAYDLRRRELVMVRNDGVIANLPDDAMVEVPAYITCRGPEPVRMGEIPTFYKGLIEQQNACEQLVVEACMEGSYDKALQAFTMNKTINSSLVAKALLDDMIELNKDYWPELK